MTGPNDPFDPLDTAGFPEVVPAGPASTQLPVGEPEQEVVYDTGSDAWWRAQAAAQRAAAEQETVPLPDAPAPSYVAPPGPAYVEPPALVEPTVLLPITAEPSATSPLDQEWEPADIPDAEPEPQPDPERQPAPEPQPDPEAQSDPEPQPEPIWAATPAEAGVEAASDTSYAEDLLRERPGPPSTPVGPLQAAAGAGIAVLGVALAIGALFVFNHHDDSGSPAVVVSPPALTSAAPTPTTNPTPSVAASSAPSALPTATGVATANPVLAAPIVPVSVLNNSKIKNLAKRAAADFSAGGWPIGTEGNYRGGTIATTTVYYAPGQRASAERFAKQFGIGRVSPRFIGLPTTGMTVVVTRDYGKGARGCKNAGGRL